MAAAKPTSDEDVEALRREIARLQAALSVSKTENEAAARRAMYFRNSDEEEPTGETIKVRRALKPWMRTEDEQDWQEVEVPTFFYKVDMPPIGGVQIMIDGHALQHGLMYRLTLDQVRTIKSIVFNLYAHDASIHGDDENVYRPQIRPHLSMKTGGRVS